MLTVVATYRGDVIRLISVWPATSREVNTRREVNLVNALKGYSPIEIIAPPEIVENHTEVAE